MRLASVILVSLSIVLLLFFARKLEREFNINAVGTSRVKSDFEGKSRESFNTIDNRELEILILDVKTSTKTKLFKAYGGDII